MLGCPKAQSLDLLSPPANLVSKDIILSICLWLSNLHLQWSCSPKLQTCISNSYLTITCMSNRYTWSSPESLCFGHVVGKLSFTSVSPILVMPAPYSRCLGQTEYSHPIPSFPHTQSIKKSSWFYLQDMPLIWSLSAVSLLPRWLQLLQQLSNWFPPSVFVPQQSICVTEQAN